jgi:hypothetical protein
MAGGRSRGTPRRIDLQMAQLLGSGRRRRAQESRSRYPRREAVGPERVRMGPFCVCVEG